MSFFYAEYQVEPEGEDVHVFTVPIDASDPETALQIAGHAGRRATFESWIALGPKDINFSARIVGREVAPRAA